MDTINEMIKSMKETNPNPKYLKETFSEIAQMEDCQNVTINIEKINCKNEAATLIKEDTYYFLQFESKTSYQNSFNLLFDIEIKFSNDIIYNAINASFSKLELQLELNDLNKLFKYTIRVNQIKKGAEFSNNFYRMVLKIPSNVSIMHPFSLPVQSYSSETSFTLGLLNITFGNFDYDVFEAKENKSNYIILDSKNIVSYDDFYNQTLAILVSLGFYTTHFFQNECYIIESDVPDYTQVVGIEYKTLRKSVDLQFNFLGYNPFNYFDINEAQKHQAEMPFIDQKCINKLVGRIYDNETIQNCLFVFIVANDNPLDTQPACISVALEGLCNTIMEDYEDRTNPIKDKSMAKEIKKDFKKILEKYKDKIDDGSAFSAMGVSNILAMS